MATSTFADSNRVSVRGIAEDTANWGVTPETGKTRELRITSSSLTLNKETVMSDELRADRQVSSIVEIGATTEGEIAFELSAGSHDDYLQAFVLGHWTRPMSFDAFRGVSVSWTGASTIRIGGGDYTGYFVSGRKVKTEGFANPSNNGYFTLSNVVFASGATVLTVSSTNGVAEAGNATGRVIDANDAILVNSTLRLGFGGEATLDSNGSNAFAAAIAAEQLVPGQVVFLEGAGIDTATITFDDAPTVADTVIVSDGESIQSFVAGTDFAVGADEEEAAENLANAINSARTKGRVEVDAIADEGVVTLRNLRLSGGSVEVSVGSAVVVDFAGFDPAARGFFTLVSVTDDVLTFDRQPSTVSGSFTLKGSMLRNPGDLEDITPQSFTLETAFNDVNQYMVHDGCRVGTYSLEVTSGAIVTGTFSVAGKATRALPSTKLGDTSAYTVLQSTATEVMNATTNVGSLRKDGQELATAIQSITLEGDATLRNQNAVSSKFPRGIGTGRFQLTGSMSAYFETLDLWRDFEQHNTIALQFDFIDQDKNVYYYTIPSVKITSDPVAPGGIDQDIIEELEWMAFRDAATGCMLQVDRFSSIYPV